MAKRARTDDAYGDLAAARSVAEEGRKDMGRLLEEAVAKEAEANKRANELESKVEAFNVEKRVWAKQRAVLLHNLASVYKTAKAEISRKDAQIARLRRQLEDERGKPPRRHSMQ